jgi:hypothetical protein
MRDRQDGYKGCFIFVSVNDKHDRTGSVLDALLAPFCRLALPQV